MQARNPLSRRLQLAIYHLAQRKRCHAPQGWDKDSHARIQPVNAPMREGEKGEACLLTLHLLELNIRTQVADSREAAEASGVRREKMDDSFSHTSSRGL